MKHILGIVFLLLAVAVVAATQAEAGSVLSYILAAVCILLAFAVVLVHHRLSGQPFELLCQFVEEIRQAPDTASLGKKISGPAGQLQTSLAELQSFLNQTISQAEHLEKQSGHTSSELEESTARANALEERLAGLLAHLRLVSDKARGVSNSLAKEMRQLSGLVAGVGEGMEIQRFRLNETSEAMGQIVGSVLDVSRSVHVASETAQQSREKARTGAIEVREAVSEIEEVKSTTLALQEAMSTLGEKASNISQVMTVINEVADQTNLLALNAAIEAARAGEAGRGFSVVADEVRKLAEKTMQATKEVENAVLDIQRAAKENIAAVANAASNIVQSAEKASKAGHSMDQITREMDSAAEHMSSIATATEQQSESSTLTNNALEEVSQVANGTVEQMQKFTAELVQISGDMEELDIIAQALATGDLAQASQDTKLVVWTHNMDTGIDIIDSQHKMLYVYINSLYRAMRQGQESSVIMDIIASLKEYTVTHFRSEEHYFDAAGYPNSSEHKKIHKAFVAKVLETEAQLQRGEAKVSSDLLDFLKNWLVNHIQREDHLYAPCTKRYLANLAKRTQGNGLSHTASTDS
ncbi:MAG: bacteriohemerythrin [Desulfovibrio sp.]|jgi:hemerythrin-like metal-binding protein|nr:bacteriohemerythrin [Desulfovibrio sp.]